ncbi:MAG: alpha-L-rhamnosidase N-terminal domain-containing protein, partial [Blautia sp.]
MGLSLTELLVEYLRSPLGLDEKAPRFSWQLSSDKKDTLQTAVEIRVREGKSEEEVWDSGQLSTGVSTGIAYAGKELKPCTSYVVQVEVTDNYGRKAVAETVFETGFLKKDKSVWEGADWIGAPDFHVAANARGVFVLESTFRMKEGSRRAGVVFGANDFRLLDHNQNEYGLEGENYIRYEINRGGEKPVLDIYRVGYAKEDKAEVPFATVALPETIDFGEFHRLKIMVDGDKAFTYLDEEPVDVPETVLGEHMRISGRVLNPRGHNDVLTYPRLNEIGFFAGEGDTAYFKDLTVKNLRTPGRIFVEETPEKETSIFEELPKEDGCFAVSGRQITKDPSRGAIPMLRTSIPVRKDTALRSARLYMTARGVYDVHVDGARITDNLLAPGLTQYDKQMNYQTYDLTKILKSGNNGIGVALGSGWWCDAQTFVVKNYNYFGDKEALLAKVVLEFADGDREVYTTNPETWKYFGDGPYRYSGFFLGEQYDARKKAVYDTFSMADFDDSDWT